MAGRLVMVLMAGQAAPKMQVDMEQRILRVAVAVALEDQGRQQSVQMLVMAVRAFNRPYMVPPIIMAVAVAAAATPASPLAMEGWVAVGKVGTD